MIACPNCGGNVKFDIAAQQMSCEFCKNQYDPYSFDTKQKDAEEIKDAYDVTIFTCPQCGGEILSTDDAAAGFCSFCGASTILFSRISSEERPKYIIPFKISKEQCKQSYADLVKKAIFAPNEIRDPSKIDGFRGIYMPYWAFHITEQGPFSVKGSTETRRGDYIITDHYDLKGDLDAYYKGLSYDASSTFDDTISESLAPFNVKDMQPFTPGFLSGFYADIKDVDAEVYENEAVYKAFTNTTSAITHNKEFKKYSIESAGLTPNGLGTKVEGRDYSMFPVWFMSYRNGNRVAYTTVNGQTGKIVTDLPIDPKKYLIGSLIGMIPLFILLNLFLTLTAPLILTICTILAAISLIIYSVELKHIIDKDEGANDRGRFAKNNASPEAANAGNAAASAMEAYAKIPSHQKKKTRTIVIVLAIVMAFFFGVNFISSGSNNSGLFMLIAGITCIIASIFAFIQRPRVPGESKGIGVFAIDAAVIVAAAISIIYPVNDYPFYIASIVVLVAVFLALTDVLKAFNVLSTRKLPQFNKQGGDDRA